MRQPAGLLSSVSGVQRRHAHRVARGEELCRFAYSLCTRERAPLSLAGAGAVAWLCCCVSKSGDSHMHPNSSFAPHSPTPPQSGGARSSTSWKLHEIMTRSSPSGTAPSRISARSQPPLVASFPRPPLAPPWLPAASPQLHIRFFICCPNFSLLRRPTLRLTTRVPRSVAPGGGGGAMPYLCCTCDRQGRGGAVADEGPIHCSGVVC